MNIFTAITVIAIVSIVAQMIKSLAQSKSKVAKSHHNSQLKYELEQELSQLKERVSTLEAIVTDKNYDLGKQIDRL